MALLLLPRTKSMQDNAGRHIDIETGRAIAVLRNANQGMARLLEFGQDAIGLIAHEQGNLGFMRGKVLFKIVVVQNLAGLVNFHSNYMNLIGLKVRDAVFPAHKVSQFGCESSIAITFIGSHYSSLFFFQAS